MFEKSILVCQLHKKDSNGDIAFNVLKKIANQYSNLPICPLTRGVFYIRNYTFNSNWLPPILKMADLNLTGRAEYCSGKKWKPNDPSCFIKALVRIRYVN